MNEEEIRKEIENMENDESIDFETNWEDDWAWDDEEHDVSYDIIRVDSFSLPKEDILSILNNDTRLPTTTWNGEITGRKRYSKEKVEKISEPAYGGFSNTNGISECGEFYVSKEILLYDATKI